MKSITVGKVTPDVAYEIHMWLRGRTKTPKGKDCWRWSRSLRNKIVFCYDYDALEFQLRFLGDTNKSEGS